MARTKLSSGELSAKQILALNQQKNRESLTQFRVDGDYPATLFSLAEHSGKSIESVASCLKTKGLKEQIVQIDVADLTLVVFKDDADRLAADARVLDFFAGQVRAKREMEKEPLRADLNRFISDAKAPKIIKAAFKQHVEERFKQDDLPTTIAELLKPAVPTAHEIAARLLDVLKMQREASVDSYPVPLNRLFELAKLPITELNKAIKAQIIQLDVAGSKLVVIKDDSDRLAGDARVLNFFAGEVRAKREFEKKPLRADLGKFISDAKPPNSIKGAFQQIVEARFKQNELPTSIAELLTPPLPTDHEIATRLYEVLKSQREASVDSYPVPLNRLFALADFSELPSAKRVTAVNDVAFSERVAYCGPRIGDANDSKSCILKSDLNPLLPKLAKRAFEYAVAKSTSPGKKQKATKTVAVIGVTTIFTAAALGEAMLADKSDKELFAAQFVHTVHHAELSLALGWLEIKGERNYFRLSDAHFVGTKGISDAISPPVEPQRPIVSQPAASPQFATDFDIAYRRVDARGGNRNFVKLYELREELPQYDRAAFDSGLRRLREARQYTMDSAQGGYVPLSDAERNAGIQEGSSLLVYVTRKT